MTAREYAGEGGSSNRGNNDENEQQQQQNSDWIHTWQYNVTVYPTREMAKTYNTAEPIYYMLLVLFVFIFTPIVCILFDCVVQRRQEKVMTTARKQDVIVSSLFPKNIQAKIMAEVDHEHNRMSARQN